MEMAQADPAHVHEHLCVQHGPSIATIAHAKSIIDEHDLSFISEHVYLDESTHATDFCRLLVAPLPLRFREWPASALLTDPSLGEYMHVIDVVRLKVNVARTAAVKRGSEEETVQMPYGVFQIAWRALVTYNYLQQLLDATVWVLQ